MSSDPLHKRWVAIISNISAEWYFWEWKPKYCLEFIWKGSLSTLEEGWTELFAEHGQSTNRAQVGIYGFWTILFILIKHTEWQKNRIESGDIEDSRFLFEKKSLLKYLEGKHSFWHMYIKYVVNLWKFFLLYSYEAQNLHAITNSVKYARVFFARNSRNLSAVWLIHLLNISFQLNALLDF